MSFAMHFDILGYTKKLKEVGFTSQQAEMQVEIMTEIMRDHVATKQDLDQLGKSLKHEMKDLRHELKHDIKTLELRMTIKLGTLLIIAVSVLAAIIKLG